MIPRTIMIWRGMDARNSQKAVMAVIQSARYAKRSKKAMVTSSFYIKKTS